MKKVWLTKNLGWACAYQKILQKSYEKLRTALQVSYKNAKFAANDVIRETLCQRLLLVEYFELKTTDNQSDDFLRCFLKMTYHFPKKILGRRISLTYKRLMKILRSFENRAPVSHAQSDRTLALAISWPLKNHGVASVWRHAHGIV